MFGAVTMPNQLLIAFKLAVNIPINNTLAVSYLGILVFDTKT